MAADYNAAFILYLNSDGTPQMSNASTAFGGTDTDDNVWNLGDELTTGSSYEYAGYFVSGGNTFLQFNSITATLLLSPDAALADFPSTYQIGDVPLIAAPQPACFAAGTRIATPEGERAVETLEIGDMVTTADGRAVPVRWIGRQTLHKIFAGDRARPVRVTAGALGSGLPHTDLVLTPDHALILDGLAITAGALVNGTTITLDPLDTLPDRVTYYHVETTAHDAILANGAAAETFVDAPGRRAFDNHAEYVALYGAGTEIAEMPLPRVSSARLVPRATRERLGLTDAA